MCLMLSHQDQGHGCLETSDEIAIRLSKKKKLRVLYIDIALPQHCRFIATALPVDTASTQPIERSRPFSSTSAQKHL
jgi:hypothetical protein